MHPTLRSHVWEAENDNTDGKSPALGVCILFITLHDLVQRNATENNCMTRDIQNIFYVSSSISEANTTLKRTLKGWIKKNVVHPDSKVLFNRKRKRGIFMLSSHEKTQRNLKCMYV